MADQTQSSASDGLIVAKETEAPRVQRVRVEEQKRHAARSMEQLRARYGAED